MGGGGPLMPLLAIWAAARAGKQKRQDAREELAWKRAERELRKQELESRVKDRERQSALEAWKPFADVIYKPEGADVLNRMATGGTIHPFFDAAALAAKAAGVPFDKSAFQIQPLTAPEQAQPGTLPGTPEVVAEQLLPPGFGGMQPQAPQQVSQFTPGPTQDERYQQRYPPSWKAQQGERKVESMEDRARAYRMLVESGVPVNEARAILLGEEARKAGTEADILDQTKAALIDKAFQEVRNLYAKGDLMGAQEKLAEAQALIAEGEPGRRERLVKVAERGVGVREKAQSAEEVYQQGTLGLREREVLLEELAAPGKRTLTAAQAARLNNEALTQGWSDSDKREWDVAKSIVLARPQINPISGKPELAPYAEDQVSAAKSKMAELLRKNGQAGGGGGGGGTAGAGQFRQDQINDMSRRMDAGTADRFIQNAPAELQPTLRAIRQHVNEQRKAKGKR